MKIAKSKNSRGSTVLELVVILAIIILFVGLLVPEIKNYIAESKKAKFLALYQKLADAAMKYWADTGQYPIEDSRSTTQANHQLFYRQNIPGWSGPYIDKPLTREQNPYDMDNDNLPDQLVLYNELERLDGVPDVTLFSSMDGYDLDGNSATGAVGPGNEIHKADTTNHVYPGSRLIIINNTQNTQLGIHPDIEAAIDRNIGGNPASSGRVKFSNNLGPSKSIFIFTMDQP